MQETRQPAPAADADASRDASIVAAARAGDRGAFARLHRRYERLVHGILLSRVRPDEADDLLQDVFVAALERLGTLAAVRTFGGWIAQIARHRAIDHLRRRRPTSEVPDDLAADRNDAASREAAEVLATLQTLPDAYRETLTLRLVEGMTGPEIAEQTGLTPGSVRVNLHRGMKLLRERLGQESSHG